MKTLEQYIRENYSKFIIDHTIRADIKQDGKVVFYIHASGYDSDTIDFEVIGNELKPIKN